MSKILDGKKIAQQIRTEIKKEVAILKKNGNKAPHIAAVLVGNNGASITYINNKIKACKEVGFLSTLIHLKEFITEKELLVTIQKLNNDNNLDGYIVQLPLPKHINEQKILLAIKPNKDIDGFHPINFGKMALGIPTFIPATPYGIVEILKRYDISTESKHCVVIGRSNIVGRPISVLMSQKRVKGNATVTLAHSKTNNLKEITQKADILICALGIPDFISANMVKEQAVVIDVGITRVPNKKHSRGYILKGDVNYEEVIKKALFITPVPGGIGPMTIAMLLKNTLKAMKNVL